LIRRHDWATAGKIVKLIARGIAAIARWCRLTTRHHCDKDGGNLSEDWPDVEVAPAGGGGFDCGHRHGACARPPSIEIIGVSRPR